jgi:hypothetical protein
MKWKFDQLASWCNGKLTDDEYMNWQVDEMMS